MSNCLDPDQNQHSSSGSKLFAKVIGRFCLCCHQLTFFKMNIFQKKIFQEPYQSVKRFGSRSGATLCHLLIWVQTVCKGYQQICLCCDKLTFCKSNFSNKNLSGTLSKCQRAWIQIRSDIMSVLIWVQTVC